MNIDINENTRVYAGNIGKHRCVAFTEYRPSRREWEVNLIIHNRLGGVRDQIIRSYDAVSECPFAADAIKAAKKEWLADQRDAA